MRLIAELSKRTYKMKIDVTNKQRRWYSAVRKVVKTLECQDRIVGLDDYIA
jgi:hypothetical protein